MIQIKKYLIAQFLALVLLLVTGCVTNERVGDMTVLSTQNVTLDKVDLCNVSGVAVSGSLEVHLP